MNDKPFKIQIDVLLYLPNIEQAKTYANEIKQIIEEDYIEHYEKEAVVVREVTETTSHIPEPKPQRT